MRNPAGSPGEVAALATCLGTAAGAGPAAGPVMLARIGFRDKSKDPSRSGETCPIAGDVWLVTTPDSIPHTINAVASIIVTLKEVAGVMFLSCWCCW